MANGASERPEDQRITVKVTIEGHPESVLRDLNAMRANTKKSVLITVEVRRQPYNLIEPYLFPQIVNGDSHSTAEHLAMLVRQGRLEQETEARLARLIEEFRRLTE